MGNPARNTEHLVPWKPGQSGNPSGRPRGARSKLSELTLQKLLADFEANGDSVIQRVRTHQPANYLQAIVSLLPKQQEKLDSPFADLSDEELALLEAFLKSTRAKTVTIIDADASVQDARERADVAQPADHPQPLSHDERQRARAAAQQVSPQTLSDDEIAQRLDNALNSPKRDNP
jgi:hypothetical protein